MAAIDLNDYWEDVELRARMLEALDCYAEGALPPPTPLKPSPQGISKPSPLGISSSTESKIEPAAAPPIYHPELMAPLIKPELIVPKDPDLNMMYELFEIHKKTEEHSLRSVKIFKVQVKQEMHEIEQLNEKRREALEKHAKEMENKNTWGVLGTIAQYIASAGTIVLGISLIATGVGAAAGALLIASGGLGLLNRIMSDTGAWSAVVAWFTKSEELQRKIAQRIDMGMFFLSLGLGLAGGIWGLQAGGFTALKAAGTEAIGTKVGQILSIAGGASTAVTRVGEAATEKKIKKVEAFLIQTEGKSTIDYENINEETKAVENMFQTMKSMSEELQSAIRNSKVQFD